MSNQTAETSADVKLTAEVEHIPLNFQQVPTSNLNLDTIAYLVNPRLARIEHDVDALHDKLRRLEPVVQESQHEIRDVLLSQNEITRKFKEYEELTATTCNRQLNLVSRIEILEQWDDDFQIKLSQLTEATASLTTKFEDTGLRLANLFIEQTKQRGQDVENQSKLMTFIIRLTGILAVLVSVALLIYSALSGQSLPTLISTLFKAVMR